jgi:hypothetical protein
MKIEIVRGPAFGGDRRLGTWGSGLVGVWGFSPESLAPSPNPVAR